MIKQGFMLAATILVLGTAESTAQNLSETLAELEALGLRVELQTAGEAPVVAAPAPAPAPAGTTQQNPIVDLWTSLTNGLDNILRRNAIDTRNEIINAIRDACRLNLTEDGEGFELALVAVSLGSFVTASFSPTDEFCSQMPDDAEGR